MKTRRHIYGGMVMTAAALLCLAGCKKDEEGEKVVLGVDFEQTAGMQKTYIGNGDKTIYWSTDDQVKVNGTNYLVHDGVVEVNMCEDGYAAVYPATAVVTKDGGSVVIPATQTYIADANGVQQLNAPMAARLDSKTGRLLFRNLYAVIKVTVKATTGADFILKSITVQSTTSNQNLAGTQEFSFNNAPTNEAAPTFGELSNPNQSVTLNFPEPYVTITQNTEKDFYLYTLPLCTAKLAITLNGDLEDHPTTGRNNVTIDRSRLGHTTVDAANLKPNAIGTFTINEAGSKVTFSPGNLYWNGSYFDFEANQWDYPSIWSDNHVGHLYWRSYAKIEESYVANFPLNSENQAGDVLFTNNPNFEVRGQKNIWRTLTHEEWDYLLRQSTTGNTVRSIKKKSNSYPLWCLAVVNNVNGMIIFPDGWTNTDFTFGACNFTANSKNLAQWKELEAQGCVFLPAAGYRIKNKNLQLSGTYGTYLSADYHTTSEIYHTYFQDNAITFDSKYAPDGGRCIRLVKSCATN